MTSLLQTVLLEPASARALVPLQWDLLIRQARRANLLARLEAALQEAGTADSVPDAPRQHLRAAATVAARQAIAVRWEVECIRQALLDTGAPTVLLKGAAYAMANLPVAASRLYADVDILVPESRVAAVESALMLAGWKAEDHDAYDQHYYRVWMHEIPPMRHVRRDTAIDVHHNILPKTAKVTVDAAALLARAQPVDGHDNLYVLQPVDMLLHSATHLFHEGEFVHGLRDLFDLDSLLRDFGTRRGFWDDLVPRAQALGLMRPLYYALTLTAHLLQTPIPEAVLAAAQAGRPPAPLAALMVSAYRLALRPQHASVDSRSVRTARGLLYLRAHWLRLPLHLLVFHLTRKAVLRLLKRDEDAIPDPAEPPQKR